MSYSLLGMFGVSIPVIYGEGGRRARKRLLAEIGQEAEASKPQVLSAASGLGVLLRPSSNVPFHRDPDVINRGTLLNDIQDRLSSLTRRAALVGLGGAGYDSGASNRAGESWAN